MRTTLTLDADVYQSARGIARQSGEPLGKVVSDLARRGLQAPPLPIGINPVSGLPYIKVPPGTPTITAASVQKFLDEEGWF